MLENTDFGVLGLLLQGIQYGVTVLADNSKVYSNVMAEKLYIDFPDLLNEILSYVKSGLTPTSEGEISADFKKELHLLDCNKQERYIDVEVVSVQNVQNAKLITFIDNTESRLSGLIDELTRLGNRAMLEQKLSSLAGKEGTYPISIIEGDLNGLKLVNDVFGHATGDELLIETAKILQGCVRGTIDSVCRWGGDEFAVIFPHVPERDVKGICERIITLCKDSILEPIPPSISLGYATQAYWNEPLENVFQRAEAMMYNNKLVESSDNRRDIMNTLRKIMWVKSTETVDHCVRMGKLFEKLGPYLDINPEEERVLAELAQFHDIGNAALPKDISGNTGKYTEDQRQVMQHHVVAGFMAVKAVPEYVHLATPILQHHEAWDGSGYPNGIKGDKINKLARILTIVDAYERITAKGGYTPEVHNAALNEIRELSGVKYDPTIVEQILTAKDCLVRV